MGKSLSIHTAKPSDLGELLMLYAELNPSDPVINPSVAVERLEAIRAQPGMTIFIGFAAGMPVATVTLAVIPNLTRNGASYALIENVVTAAAHRKKGYGATLIAHAIDKAWDAGCYKVMLLTGSQEPSTLRFYESCGFVQNKTGYQVRRPEGI